MSENAYVETYSGQEVQLSDLDQIGTTAGLADDHVLAECLRLAPYTGSAVSKAILPTGYRAQSAPATVQTSGSANGSINVNPFRAIVGSRNTVAAAPTGLSTDSAALANWRDIRSGVFVGTAATTLYKTIPLAANASGSPRWDLVYASIAVDANGPTVNRRVKNPTTGVIAVQNVPAYLCSPVTVAVITGTPGSTPALPTLPADGAGVYNIPLSYVAVPNGFTTTTTVIDSQIRTTTVNGVSEFADIKAGIKAKPCNGNNDGNTAFNGGGNFAWNPAGALPRPAPWLPPDWIGGGVFVAQIDNTGATPSTSWSHQSLGVIDNSVDWRYRIIRVTGVSHATLKFASDPTNVAGVSPLPGGNNSIFSTSPYGTSGNALSPLITLGSSFIYDSLYGTANTYATVWQNQLPLASPTYNVALMVNMTTGALTWYTSGTGSNARFFFWIECTAQFPNP